MGDLEFLEIVSLKNIALPPDFIKSAKHRTINHVKIFFYHTALSPDTTFELKTLFPLISTGYVFQQNYLNSTTN
jgi:hypothetical protein